MMPNALPVHVQIGFLTVFSEANGYVGGYLVTNSWGRPLEFRLSTAVQPNRVQQILYSGTLTEYLCADLIGKTLIDKTNSPIHLLLTDSLTVLPIRSLLSYPVLALPTTDSEQPDTLRYRSMTHARSSKPLYYLSSFEEDVESAHALLERIDPSVDLHEPFGRIREAMTEARKMGVTNRAA